MEPVSLLLRNGGIGSLQRRGGTISQTVTPVPATSLANEPVARAVRLALLFAAIKLALHIAANLWETHLGWGYFRDELYYIVCGQHLAWGYVDQGPIVALQARLGIALFGRSLAGLRMFSAMAGAGKVFLTGLIAWSLGGRRAAQALAMLGVLVAPQFLGLDSFLSMNSFEPVFWMTCMLAVLLMLRGGSARWWIVFGVAGGLGLENKPSMTFFLVALLAGLLLTPQRRVLFSRWCAAAIGLLVLLALPNLLWQVAHHWPTLEFLHDGRVEHKNVTLPPLPFIRQQIDMLHPLNVFLWGAGLIWLLVSRRAAGFRFLGWTYLLFLGIMIALGAKDYYVAPVYPALFAAGGVAWQSLLRRPRTRWMVPAYALLLPVTGALIAPMALPILTPQTWLAYTAQLHLRGRAPNSENTRTGALPQFYADRFGWQELADKVTRIYQGLSPADQAKAGILCSNYGEASAINFLGAPGAHLPFAISGHNNYYLWGPHNASGEVMIVINGASLEEMKKFYNSVEVAGEMNNPYSMPYEERPIYLCRGRKGNLTADWLEFKHYI